MVREDRTYDKCILYTCVESLMMKCIILYIYMLNLKMPKDGDVGLCKPKKKKFSKFIVLTAECNVN